MKTANTFIPAFLQKFNDRFSKTPPAPKSAHKPILSTHSLDRIFCIKDTKNLTRQYENVVYEVLADKKKYTLLYAAVDVLELKEGSIRIERQGKRLVVRRYDTLEEKTEVVSSKEQLKHLRSQKSINQVKSTPMQKKF